MKKRISALLLALVMVCSVFPLSAQAVETGFAGTTVNGMASSDSASGGPLSLAEVTQENDTVSLTDAPETTDQPDVSVTVEETETGAGSVGLDNEEDTPAKQQEPADDDVVTFVVTLQHASLLEAGFSTEDISEDTRAVQNYRASQQATLNNFIETLSNAYGDEEGFSIGYTYTASTTGLSVTTSYGNKAEIAQMPQVKQVYVAPMFKVPEDQVSLAPLTTNATSMIGSNVLNESGYTGKGMRIAILDTGIYLNSPNFAALSADQLNNPLTAGEIAGVWSSLNASRGNANAQTVYRNTKVPFAFNYNDGNLDESHAGTGSDHGTHVAGIAAANKIETGTGSDVVGVAPEAQLLVMKVFGSSGAGWDVVMAALEDCVYLDVDVANLSLGTTAGFTDEDADMNTVLTNLENAGVQVVIASGNDTNNALQNLHGNNMSKIENPDIGLTSAPGTYSVALSVASVDNDKSAMLYFTVNGRNIGYVDTGNPNSLIRLLNQSGADHAFVVIDGFGESAAEFAPAAGKIAVVARGGGVSFADKQQNAQTAGCTALIIYNNTAGTINMGINTGAEFIPCVSITNTDGAYLAGLGTGPLTITTQAMDFQMPKTVSDFSSWGSTPDLKLKPEIAGVGGNIYSTRDPSYVSSGYGYMSGTSMATPQIAGAVAVLRQYLEENYPDLTEQEMQTMEAQLLMSTADPVTSDDNLPVSPRAQGTGLANLVEATAGEAYLSSSSNDQQRPKGEFGDDPERTGVYTFPFTVTNISSETQRYTVDADVITESIVSGEYISNSPHGLAAELTVSGSTAGGGLKYDFNADGQITTADARVLLRHVQAVETVPSTDLRYDYLDVNSDGTVDQADVRVITDWCAGKSVSVNLLATLDEQQLDTIEVPAGQSMTLTATITLTDADKTYLNQFPNGIYVEGFMYLNNQNADGVSLNMPFLGFYGDWSEAPVFDDATDPSLYGRTIYTWNSTLLGRNPYIGSSTRVGDAYNAFSYANPLAELDFGMLRNAKKLAFTVTDVSSGEEYFYREAEYAAKSFYNSTYGTIYPFYIYNATATESNVWRGLDAKGNQLPDGTTVNYTVDAWVDDGDNIADDSWSFQVTLDSQKPQILNSADLQSAVAINQATGEVTLTLEMQDNGNLAALLFVDKNNKLLGRFEVANTPGQPVTQNFNITGFGPEFTIILGDYACNELELDVSLELGDYSDTKPQPKQLDYGRIYGSEASGLSNLEKGWFSMGKDLAGLRNETGDTTTYFSAEYVNGRIIAQRNDGDLVVLTPYSTYWESYLIQESTVHEGQSGFITLYDMALDYVSQYSSSADSLYAVGWTYAGDNNGDGADDGTNNLYRLDFAADGSCNIVTVAKLNGLSNGAEMLTLACDNNGQLYGISNNCIFYKIDKNTGQCTMVRQLSEFSGKPNYVGLNVVQSMCFDHDNGGIYWMAHSQNRIGGYYIDLCYTYKIDPATGSMEEIGTFGPTGASALFIPTKMQSNLINFTDAQPTGFTISPAETWLLAGRTVRFEAAWTPWNAQPTAITWESSAPDIASVSTSGMVTGHKAGSATITAKAQVLNASGDWVQASATAKINVTASNDSIYGYIATDDNNNANQFTWVTYSDQSPSVVTQLNKPAVSTGSAPWQGGAYYNGYVYTVMADQWTEGGVIYSGTSLYRTQVTENGDDPTKTVFGTPEKVGTTTDIEVGNLGFDYNTGRLYGVDLTHNGLCIIDRTTGSMDPVVEFTDPSGTFNTLMTAMTVICQEQETIILCGDMDGKLYTVDPNTGVLTCVYGGNGQEYWYYAAMGYDYNTGNIYWNPSMGSGNNPLNLVRLQKSADGTYSAQVTKIGDVASKYGVEQVVIFTVPDEEPTTAIIPVESIEITNGDIIALEGSTIQLKTVTTPERPTVQTRTWTSSNPNAVSVDHFGVITCKSGGSATITVELEGRTDSINVTVLPSAGEMEAFLVNDQDGSGYFDFWLSLNDYAPGKMQATDSMIGVYSMRTGAYFDGDYYVYDNLGKFMRIDAADHTKYTVLGTISDVVSGMAYDYTTNTMYAVTAPSQAYNEPIYGKLCRVNLGTGALSEVATLDAPIHALAADGDGTLYGIGGMLFGDAGSADIPTKLYTIDTTNGMCTEMMQYTDGLSSVNICSDGGMASYKPQMTYDYTTNRLYVSATASDKALAASGTNSYGLVMIQLGETPAVSNLGKMAIEIRGSAKTGMLHLGLLCAIPEASELPESDTAAAVEINKDYATCVPNGQTQLRATVKPSGVDQSVVWSSNDDTIATVDQSGLVTGVSPGVVTITATRGDLSDTCQVTVIAATQGSVAYTVTPSQGLITFDPETPYNYTVVNSTVNGNVVGMDISGSNLYYMVQDPDYTFPCIYRYDLTTKMNTFLGCVNANIVNYSDIAYDEGNDILYVTNGNYISAFFLSRLSTAQLLSPFREQLLYDTPHAIAVVDGTLYAVVREFTVNGTFSSLMTVDFDSSTGEYYSYVKRGLAVDSANNVCEMDYNPATGTLLFSDAKNCVYSISLDGETVTPIDCVGDVLEIKGIAIGG